MANAGLDRAEAIPAFEALGENKIYGAGDPRKMWRRSIRRVQTLRAFGVDIDAAGVPAADPTASVSAMRSRLQAMGVELENAEHQLSARRRTLRKSATEWEEVGLPADDPRIVDETALGWKKLHTLDARIAHRRENAAAGDCNHQHHTPVAGRTSAARSGMAGGRGRLDADARRRLGAMSSRPGTEGHRCP